MSEGATGTQVDAQGEATLHATLRFAVGVTAAFVLSEWLQWVPTFMAPALTAVLLANLPTRPPLKMSVALIGTMAVAALFAFALAALLRGTPFVLFGLIALCMFLAFHVMASGRQRLPAMLLLICLATIPVVVMIAPVGAEILPVALIRGIAMAVVLIAVVYIAWPRVPRPKAAIATTPGDASPLAIALLSTAVVVPLMLFYLLFGLADALPVMVATVMLVANFDLQRSRMHALGMVAGNFAGGLLALLLHAVLMTTPSLPFLALLLFVVLLGFGQRIVAGGPAAAVALIACNTMLIILSSSLASDSASLALWLTRLLQFALAAAFAVGMMNLIWHRATPRAAAGFSDPATGSSA
jgi:DUF2955 family protein/fusaric acid resistance family protein